MSHQKNERGFFTMGDVTRILSGCKSLKEAQDSAHELVNIYVDKHPKVRVENVRKAVKMIETSRNIQQLGQGMTEFILAHTSENLKVIK